MSGPLILHPLAEQELDDAAEYYGCLSQALSRRFLNEIQAFTDKILANPLRYSIRIKEVRRANLKEFPYHLNYFLHGAAIAIVAVSHDRQRPYYWRGRLKNRDWLAGE
jgi:plasmid stabilization system protein ParE